MHSCTAVGKELREVRQRRLLIVGMSARCLAIPNCRHLLGSRWDSNTYKCAVRLTHVKGISCRHCS